MLTAKQHQTFQFISQYIAQNGYAPTEAEIAQGIGISSRGVVHRYVTALAQAGFIRIVPGRRRNIALLQADEEISGLPILGKIAAGRPIEAVVSNQLFDFKETFNGSSQFILEVKGDSMIGDNICDGDYIICEKADTAEKNAIVVALIDDEEATLKRYYPNRDKTVSLIPSNPALSPLVYRADQVRIQGIYLGLLRLVNRKRN